MKALSECRFCHNRDMLTPVLDFGEIPLVGAFLTEEEISKEVLYPFTVLFCENCGLVQVKEVVSGETLFNQYFFYSSKIKTLVEHFEGFATDIQSQFQFSTDPLVVEIGCNDGVMLKPLIKAGVRAIGVDPATNVVESSGWVRPYIINDFFTEKLAKEIRKEHGQANAIVSSFSFAHIDDMDDVMRGVEALLRGDGVLIFEIYYVGIILEELQYDMLYHEHHSYYSLTALQSFLDRYGMEVFEAKRVSLRAGAIRFFAGRKGVRHIQESVWDLLRKEIDTGLDKVEAFRSFEDRIHETKTELLALLNHLKGEGKSIVGYGASGRSAIIMNYCGIDDTYLDYIVDDAPAKQDHVMPGVHLPIKSWGAVERDPPDYLLIFAWSFLDEIKKKRVDYLKRGGQFIIPLPEVEVMSYRD